MASLSPLPHSSGAEFRGDQWVAAGGRRQESAVLLMGVPFLCINPAPTLYFYVSILFISISSLNKPILQVRHLNDTAGVATV